MAKISKKGPYLFDNALQNHGWNEPPQKWSSVYFLDEG